MGRWSKPFPCLGSLLEMETVSEVTLGQALYIDLAEGLLASAGICRRRGLFVLHKRGCILVALKIVGGVFRVQT